MAYTIALSGPGVVSATKLSATEAVRSLKQIELVATLVASRVRVPTLPRFGQVCRPPLGPGGSANRTGLPPTKTPQRATASLVLSNVGIAGATATFETSPRS